MMNSGTPFFQELCNWGISRGWLKKFDSRFSKIKHRDTNFLIGYFFDIVKMEAKSVSPKFKCFSNFAGCNPQVVNLHY